MDNFFQKGQVLDSRTFLFSDLLSERQFARAYWFFPSSRALAFIEFPPQWIGELRRILVQDAKVRGHSGLLIELLLGHFSVCERVGVRGKVMLTECSY